MSMGGWTHLDRLQRKVDEANLVSLLNHTPIFGSLLVVQSF